VPKDETRKIRGKGAKGKNQVEDFLDQTKGTCRGLEKNTGMLG